MRLRHIAEFVSQIHYASGCHQLLALSCLAALVFDSQIRPGVIMPYEAVGSKVTSSRQKLHGIVHHAFSFREREAEGPVHLSILSPSDTCASFHECCWESLPERETYFASEL